MAKVTGCAIALVLAGRTVKGISSDDKTKLELLLDDGTHVVIPLGGEIVVFKTEATAPIPPLRRLSST
jgi:hypothetical protein